MKSAPLIAAVLVTASLVWMFVIPTKPDAIPSESPPPDALTATLYWTPPVLEPDTCVAAWLLSRLVTPSATIAIREKSKDGATADQGTPFDMPGCTLQRSPGLSTSDVVMQTYNLDNDFARKAVGVVRELELKPWTTNDDEFFVRIRSGLADALNASKDDTVCMTKALAFLDDLYGSYRSSDAPDSP